VAGFERFAQRLEYAPLELRQLVEEQHAVVGERDLARAWIRAAADQRGGRGRMVRRLIGTPLPVLDAEAAVQGMDGCGLQRFLVLHRRQQAGEARGEHRLAGAGRAGHQQAVAAGRGDFQRALGLRLALHVRQVGIVRRADRWCAGKGRERLLAVEVGADLQERLRRQDRRAADQCRLGGALRRQHEAARLAARRQAHRQCAAHRAQLARERQLAGELVFGQALRLDLPRGGKDAQRDRQVEAPRLLRQVGRRQVDRNAAGGKLEARVLDRRAHPLASLLHLGVGQPYDGEGRQTAAEVHLDGDFRRFHAGEGAALQDGEGHDAGSVYDDGLRR